MSIRARLAAAPDLFAKPGIAEAALVASLIVIVGIIIYMSFSGELARLIETTTPYAPGT